MKAALHKLIFRLLALAVKVCLRHGVKLQEVGDILKEVYVSEAKLLLDKTNIAPSVSRISAMTGVHRKDVTKISEKRLTKRKKPNFLARIVTHWQHDKNFSISNGTPQPLSTKGRNSQFADLVDAVTGGEVDPYSALFELERIGAVEHDRKKKTVKLLWENYVPPIEEESAIEMLVEDSEDLTAAILSNIDLAESKNKDQTPHLHLKTEYTRIPSKHIKDIQKFLLNEGKKFHLKVRKYLSRYDLDLNPAPMDPAQYESSKDNTSPEIRVAACTFSFTEEKNGEKNNV